MPHLTLWVRTLKDYASKFSTTSTAKRNGMSSSEKVLVFYGNDTSGGITEEKKVCDWIEIGLWSPRLQTFWNTFL
jgi:hypothetical protein